MTHDALLWRSLLTALLGAACVTDLRARRIPNALVAATFAAALARSALATWGSAPVAEWAAGAGMAAGPGAALLAAACGLAAWLPLYAVGAFGAGDVKLFAATAAWFGPQAVVPMSVYAALAGGALGLAWFAAGVARRPSLALACAAAGARPPAARAPRVPYALAITAGVLAAVWGVAP